MCFEYLEIEIVSLSRQSISIAQKLNNAKLQICEILKISKYLDLDVLNLSVLNTQHQKQPKYVNKNE